MYVYILDSVYFLVFSEEILKILILFLALRILEIQKLSNWLSLQFCSCSWSNFVSNFVKIGVDKKPSSGRYFYQQLFQDFFKSTREVST